jgi:Fic family protein
VDRSRFQHSPVGHLVPLRGVDARTGKDYDHVAFSPDPLSAVPALRNSTWTAVSEARHELGRLSQAAQLIPNPERLRQPTLNREAQSTSALEGTYAPLNEVMASEVVENSEGLSAALREVRNYVTCARYAFDWISDGRPLTVGVLLHLHQLLVRGTAADTADAGQIRSVPVVIGSRSAPIQAARFIPPPPGIELKAALSDFLRWVVDRPADRDPVVAAAMAHYQFETLHPFNDGNGRIGRLLVVVQLMSDGALTDSLLSISPWFEARRTDYQDHLAEVSASGDWDSWIRFFAQGLAASAIDTVQRVDALLELQRRYAKTVREAGGRGLIAEVVDLLIGRPFVSIRQVSDLTGKTHPAVSTAFGRLIDLGILTEVTGKSYGRLYMATEVMAIYSSPAHTSETAQSAG